MISRQTEQTILNTIIERTKTGNKINAERTYGINTEYYTDKNYTMCKMTSIVLGATTPTIIEVGFSKRNPNYPHLKYNQLIGEQIAFANTAKRYIIKLIETESHLFVQSQ